MSNLSQTPDIEALVLKYHLTHFVETGCSEGDALRYARDDLKLEHRYSCDLRPDACARCADLGNIACTDSVTFLRQIAQELPGNRILFWLDAHFPIDFAFTQSLPSHRWPVPQELQILAGMHGIDQCVIVCDDMHALQDPDNPTKIDWLPDYNKSYGTVKALTDTLPMLRPTLHEVGNGLLVFEPR